MRSLDPHKTNWAGHQLGRRKRKNLHLVLALQTADGSVLAVETVLQVDLGLPNEVI